MGRKYAKNFRQRTDERKQAVGYRCEHCGAAERTIAFSKTGSPYMVHLAGSHKNHDPENPNADLQVLCQACHCTFDAKHHAEVRKANTAKKKARAEAQKGGIRERRTEAPPASPLSERERERTNAEQKGANHGYDPPGSPGALPGL